MDPLRKDEKIKDETFEEKLKNETRKPADISQSRAFERERDAERAEAQTAERMSVPMGPMAASVPPTSVPAKREAKDPEASSGPRLVAKDSPSTAEVKKTCFFSDSELQEMRARLEKIQAEFVDQPRQSVEDADTLVGEAIKKLAEQFDAERSNVVHSWNSGDNISTEMLRQSLRRYRTFFERLLAA